MNSLSSSIKTALAGFGALLGFQGAKSLGSSFLDAARQMELYRMKLKAIVKDARETDAVFRRISDWAAKNPVNTDEAIDAFILLKAAAVQNSEEAIRAVASISTVMQRDMREVAQAIVSTEVEPLRNLGILLDRTGEKAILQSGDVRLAVEKDIDSVRKGIIDLISLNFAGALDDAAKTFDGSLKMIDGLWSKLKTDIMGKEGEDGPFGVIAKGIAEVANQWAAWIGSSDYRRFIGEVQKSAVDAIRSLDGLGETLSKTFRLAAENIDKVLSGLKGLVGYKITGGLLALLGVTGPAGTAIAATGGALVYLSDQFPPVVSEAEKLEEELLRIESAAQALKEQLSLNETMKITVDDRDLVALEGRAKAIRAILPRLNALSAADKYDEGKRNSQTASIHPYAEGETTPTSPIVPKADAAKKAGGGGLSPAVALVQKMRDEMRYLGAEGKSFLPVLDAWAAKLKPLSDGWKAIVDLQREIRETSSQQAGEETAAALERSRKAKEEMEAIREASQQGVERFWGEKTWENQQGLLPDVKYLDMLRDALSRLTVGTEEWRARFSDVQSVAERVSSLTINSLAGQFENGQISVEQYRQALQGLIDQWSEYPLVVQQVQAQMTALDASVSGTTKNIQTLAAEAQRALVEDLAAVPDTLAGAFANAVVNSENLGDALRSLAKDIAYVAIKAMLLKAIGGIFGGAFGGTSSAGATGGILDGAFGGASGAAAHPSLPTHVPNATLGPDRTFVAPQGEQNSPPGQTVVHMTVHAVDAPSFVRMLESNRAAIEGVVVNSLQRNGPIRHAVRSAYA